MPDPVWLDTHGAWLLGLAGCALGLLGLGLALASRHAARRRQADASAQLFRALFHDGQSPQMLIAPDGRIVDVNETCVRFYGYPREAMLGMSHGVINTAERSVLDSSLQRALLGQQRQYVARHRLANGETRVVDVNVSPIPTAAGPQLHATIHDITRRRVVERELLAAYRRLRAHKELIDRVLLVVFADMDGVIIRCNPRFARTLGYEPDDLAGRRMSSLHAGETDRDVIDDARGHIARLEAWRGEVALRHRDGTTVWLDLSFLPGIHALTNGPGVSAVAIDISARKRALSDLDESERRHRELFVHSPLALALLDVDTMKVIAINDAMVQLGGYRREELLGINVLAALNESDREGFASRFETIRRDPDRYANYRVELHRKDGTPFTAEVNARTIKTGGRLARLISLRDITAEHRATTALEQQHALSEAIRRVQARFMLGHETSAAFGPFVETVLRVTGSTHGFIGEIANPKSERRLLRVIAARTVADRAPAEPSTREFDESEPIVGAVLRATAPLSRSIPTTEPAHARWIPGEPAVRNFLGVPLVVGDQPLGILVLFDRDGGFTTDMVTALGSLFAASANLLLARRLEGARRRADDMRRDAVSRLEMATELAGIGVYEWDFDHGRTMNNARSLEIFGLRPDDIDNNSPAPLRALVYERVVPQDRDRMRAHLAELRTSAVEHADMRYGITRPDGTRREIHTLSKIQRREDGSIRRVVGAVFDETEQISYQRSERARMAAEVANREKTLFLSRISHELRTPLNAILGFAQLLGLDADDRLSLEQRGYVNNIQSAGWHLLAMITEILDLSRIEAGSIAMHMEPVSVESAIHDALALISAQAEERGISIIHAQSLESSVMLMLDPTRIRQVLLNLLSNAIKYNRVNGRIVISRAVDGDELLIRVSDTGRGLDQDQLARLFTAFDRLDVDPGEVEGTGIGLVITRALVENMAGRIQVSSRVGHGSSFEIRFPLHVAPR